MARVAAQPKLDVVLGTVDTEGINLSANLPFDAHGTAYPYSIDALRIFTPHQPQEARVSNPT